MFKLHKHLFNNKPDYIYNIIVDEYKMGYSSFIFIPDFDFMVDENITNEINNFVNGIINTYYPTINYVTFSEEIRYSYGKSVKIAIEYNYNNKF